MSLMKLRQGGGRQGGGNPSPPKRLPTTPFDREHLLDNLASYIKKVGMSTAFELHSYNSKIATTNAVNARDLVKLETLLQDILEVQPNGQINYSDYKYLVCNFFFQ